MFASLGCLAAGLPSEWNALGVCLPIVVFHTLQLAKLQQQPGLLAMKVGPFLQKAIWYLREALDFHLIDILVEDQ